ncbi:MAG TPA: class I SAM-dependent methyltransferase, partial [Myxococcota bacterium]|nr:class I SAM-dependent methyltransferase [Myxococcota bacterium]
GSPSLARRVEVKDGEFARIPLPDGVLGLVFAAFRSFQHVLEVDEQLAALHEMRRVLRPGGRLALDAFDPPYGMLADTPERL